MSEDFTEVSQPDSSSDPSESSYDIDGSFYIPVGYETTLPASASRQAPSTDFASEDVQYPSYLYSDSSESVAPGGSVPEAEATWTPPSVSLASAAASTATLVKNWNEEFQRILEEAPSKAKYLKLRNLAVDFVTTAEMYARIIISELYLPPGEKTIKPTNMGGIMGGKKFVCQGILFKFAVDSLLPKSSVWMYGGEHQNTANAIKSAKHELRSLVAYYNCNILELRVPLMALIDYRGYRLIAESLLPISSATLRCGSADAGKSIHTSSEEGSLLRSAARKLNLKGHRFKSTKVYGPVDLECHRGQDQRCYVVDSARLFPPECPALSVVFHSRSIFFKLLRPELVRRLKKPLSSDAFSSFGKHKANTHNKEVEQATSYLIDHVIPEFAKKLDDEAYDLKSEVDLIEAMHNTGINVRYLGTVRRSVTNRLARALLLTEMIVRCLKNRIRANWRRTLFELKISIDSPFALVVLDQFNLVLNKEGTNSVAFWHSTVKSDLNLYFPDALDTTESSSAFNLSTSLNLVALLNRLCEMLGIRLNWTDSLQAHENRKFIYTDVETIQPKVHHMNLIDLAEGCLLRLMAEEQKSDFKLSLYDMAEVKLRRAKTHDTTVSVATHFELGLVHFFKLKLKQRSQSRDDILSAFQCFKTVLEFGRADEGPVFKSARNLIKLYVFFVNNNQAILHTLSALYSHPSTLEQELADQMDQIVAVKPATIESVIKKALTQGGSALFALFRLIKLAGRRVKACLAEILRTSSSLSLQNTPALFSGAFNLASLIGGADTELSRLAELDLSQNLPLSSFDLAKLLLPSGALGSANKTLTSIALSGCGLITDELASLFADTASGASAFPSLTALDVANTSVSDEFVASLTKESPRFFGQLRALSLSACARVSDASLKLLSAASSITALDITQCSLISNIGLLAKCGRLGSLKCGFTAARDDKLKLFLTSGRFERLQHLDLTRCGLVTDKAFETLRSPSPLKFLSLEESKVTHKTLEKLSQYCQALTYLDIGYCSDIDMGRHSTLLLTLTHLNSIVLKGIQDPGSLARLWRNLPPITSIDLTCCYDSVTDALLLVLQKESLTNLSLAGIDSLSNHALGRLAEAKNLTSLNLSICNQIVDATLSDILRSATNLRDLNISHCNQITPFVMDEIAQHCDNLEKLDLGYSRWISSLSLIGKRCSKLNTLIVHGLPKVSPNSLRELFSHGLQFQALSLKETKINDEALQAMAKSSPNLRSIDLSDCVNIGDIGVAFLIRKCPFLTNLDCTGLHITDQAFPDPSKTPNFVRDVPIGSVAYLRQLKLSGCKKLTDRTLQYFADNSRLLDTFNASGCPEMTDIGLIALIQQNPLLSSVNVSFCQKILTTEGQKRLHLVADDRSNLNQVALRLVT